ncbi:hypothetical protein GCM10014719_59910 [Planomonospora parontospora subsp. antibiotica]|nr:hypothetical protein GCM10014719_59910 [Planomonospora parontospora subsp. antibiotica]GII19009.1 hypothetical protein Ppa05_57350 [Planomonospora parontospora subsp. antibiotica]
MPVTGCLSPHLPLPQSQCKRLDWHPPRLGERVRVIAWTCKCRVPFYELCEAGGQAFIRRTVYEGNGWKVRETSRRRSAEAHAMWTALLSGLAR